jgi:molybdopterin converting factor subunit 1
VKVKVLYFAAARERTGVSSEVVELDGAQGVTITISALVEELCRRYPRLAEVRSALRLAVNLDFVTAETPLVDGDEVALIPPVSGG